MGCDIHFRVEFYGPAETVVPDGSGGVKVEPEGGFAWQPAEKLTPNRYRQMWLDQLTVPYETRVKEAGQQGGHAITDEALRAYAAEEPELSLAYEDRFYTGRHYGLFYKLSGVRGPYENITPMTGLDDWESNGFPDDVSDEVDADIGLQDGDLHSHTHYTLTELLEVDWQKFDEEYEAGFYPTILQMQAVAIEKCEGDTDKVRALFSYDN